MLVHICIGNTPTGIIFFKGSRHIATSCYSRKYSRVPLRSGKKRERKPNWIGTVHPNFLPPSLQGSRHALFNSAPVPESAEKIISTLHRLAFPNLKSVTRQLLHEIIRVLLERQNDCVQKVRKNRNAHLLHSGVGQSHQLSCPKCGRERNNNNSQWAVKWPGHYYSVRQICKSESCDGSRKDFYPKD